MVDEYATLRKRLHELSAKRKDDLTPSEWKEFNGLEARMDETLETRNAH